MAKVTRTLLKEMVKECLVEILMDGLESPAGERALVESVSRNSSRKTNPNYSYFCAKYWFIWYGSRTKLGYARKR